MKKIKIFESKSFIGVDETNPAFRREQVAKGKSVYSLSTTYQGITIHQTRDTVYTNEHSKLINAELRTFDKKSNTFFDGTWHIKVETNLTCCEDINYVNSILEVLRANPDYCIDIYEYGLFGMLDSDKGKDDIIFNWHNRHLGEIWIAENDLEKNEELKMIFENKK